MLFSLIIFIAGFFISTACPSKEELYPCTCEIAVFSKYIKCEGIENDLTLSNAVASLEKMKDIYSLTLKNAILNYIPHDLFQKIKLVELEFLSSSIMEFSDTDVAFEGLEDSLEILSITDCSYMNDWDWSLLRNLKKLMRLDIEGGDLQSIDESIRKLSSFNLEDINISRNKISHICDYTFANFTELRFLSLRNNLIKQVKRSMLPNPVPNLYGIDLAYNKISKLPEDFFQNMPSLTILSIMKNEILTLNEQVFAPIWGQLEDFHAMGNKLRCDCRMSWILEKRMPPNTRAICDQPSKLKGRNLASLISKDLWC